MSPDELLAAYARGLFPMDDPGEPGPVPLYEAEPRAILPVEGFRVPRSVARALRRAPYRIRVDAAFDEVTAACGGERDGVWLTPRLARAYGRLHREGFAHSVEAWRDGRLAGGLFGVSIGAMFTSESMFHRAPDAGNAALVGAARLLAAMGAELWDIQMASPHTRRFGAQEVSAAEYRRLLARALARPPLRWSAAAAPG
ncbi:leucyl/phenylalanyl-tRNA--protein transferase [Miltoncostaea marina]|uniref:leucyl/phenylalanyl-tRNA--protein transferase n=1 Tax=Miltoncostaea marina TaxID=2843215 RepID=UPI0031BAF792